jgi:hypothetical protein
MSSGRKQCRPTVTMLCFGWQWSIAKSSNGRVHGNIGTEVQKFKTGGTRQQEEKRTKEIFSCHERCATFNAAQLPQIDLTNLENKKIIQ